MGENCNVSAFAIVMLIVFQTGDSSLTTFTLQACYGNGFEDYLTPSCSSGEKIYIYDVYVYAKRIELNCPDIATFFDRNITYCCNYVSVEEDCGQRYFGSASEFEHAHYSRCTGLETCGGIPVAWNYTEHFCNTTIFSERTIYMKTWYNCIPDTSTVTINSASLLTANAVFLSSESYPSTMSECSATSGATCAVQTTNGSPIQITALDVQFNETAGVCLQRLYIIDGPTNTDISCNHNNQFAKRVVYTSTSDSIEIRLDNTASITTGKFWIQIEATESSENVTINCRSDTAVYGCGSSIVVTDSTTESTLSASDEASTTTTADTTEVSTTTNTTDTTEVSTTDTTEIPTTTTTTSADTTEVPTTTNTTDTTEVSTTTTTTDTNEVPTATPADTTEVSTTTTTTDTTEAPTTTTTTSADTTEVPTTTTADTTEVSTTTTTTDITEVPTTTTTTSADTTEVPTTTTANTNEVSTTTTTTDITEVPTTTTTTDTTEVSTTSTDVTDSTITTSNTSTSKLDSESSDSTFDLSWIVTIFLGSLATGVVFGSIAYALNRCKKKFTQVKDNETPRRRIAFQ